MKEDFTGKTFNRWTVIQYSHKNKFNNRFWKCICICGQVRVVNESLFKSGRSKSCGCLQKEVVKNNRIHGLAGTKIYFVWAGMKQRCTNPKQVAYKNYGGRGIKVCDEWQEFEPFYKWAAINGYEKGRQLDRINNDLGYSPENCRFITPIENECNRSNNIRLTVGNETKTISEWTREKGFKKDVISARLKLGWTPEMAVSTPVRKIIGVNT